MWVTVKHKNESILVGTFYIPPTFKNWNLVGVFIEQAFLYNLYLIIIGDFNEELLKSRTLINLNHILQSFGLKQLINDQTKTTSSLIDVILVSK